MAKNSILTPPPVPEGKVAHWNGTAWQVKDITPAAYIPKRPEGLPDGYRAEWNGDAWQIIPPEAEQPASDQQIAAAVEAARRRAYSIEADPLFFKAQRGEATMDEWLAKIEEIKGRYPEGVMPS